MRAARAVINIVVIDDDESTRRSMAAVLRNEGYSVLELSSGRDTLRKVTKLKPDLVMTELVMREVERLGLIQRLRDTAQQTRIIAMSGRERAHTYLNIAKFLGADVTLCKPFTADELLGTIRSLLADRGTDEDRPSDKY